MLGRRQMLDALDIGGPVDVGRILRSGDDEAARRPLPRRLDQQPLERRLAIGAVGAEIAEIPAQRHRVGR